MKLHSFRDERKQTLIHTLQITHTHTGINQFTAVNHISIAMHTHTATASASSDIAPFRSVPAFEGTISVGSTVRFGYNAQSRESLDPTKSVWQEIVGTDETVRINEQYAMPARMYVAQFNFKGTAQVRTGPISSPHHTHA